MKYYNKKLFFFVGLSFFVSLGLSLVFQSILALTIFPSSDPLLSNIFRKDVLINENNNPDIIRVKVPVATVKDFQVGTDALFVNETGGVAIGTTTISALLTIDGGIRIGRYTSASRPTCVLSLVGAIYFDTDINRPFVCTQNDGWLYF